MNALKVEVGEVEVGTLEALPNEAQQFTFADSYVSRLLPDRPVLGQLFEDRLPHPICVDGPVCWFAHLLPQGVMRTWRTRLLGIDEQDDFALLEYLGRDMPGAVVLTPTESPLARWGSESPPPAQADDAVPGLKFSLAGAQWKLSARSSGRGLTTSAEGEGIACIAKFDAPEYPGLPECEFATMNWARAAGVSVPDFELRRSDEFDAIPDGMPTGNGAVFTISRFDRSTTGRIHMEDFGQILDRPPGDRQYHARYEDIGRVISWIAPNSAAEFLRQIAFSVICGNGDAHLKNFSVIYPDRRNAELSPAYDIVSTICYFRPGKEQLALSLGGIRRFSEVTSESFEALYKALRISPELGRATVTDLIHTALDAWTQTQVRQAFSDKQQSRIQRHVEELPLTSG